MPKIKLPAFVSVPWVADTHGMSYNAVRRAVTAGDLKPTALIVHKGDKTAPIFERHEVSRWARAWKKRRSAAAAKAQETKP